VEELERENESNKRHIQEMHEKKESMTTKRSLIGVSKSDVKDPLKDKKVQVMEDEINELRKKLIEKDREFERVQAEMSLSKGKSKTGILKSKYNF
jgi:predicted RNase H-like nuclease (RuvC/YqgF family)